MSANFFVSASTRSTLIPASQSRPFAAPARAASSTGKTASAAVIRVPSWNAEAATR